MMGIGGSRADASLGERRPSRGAMERGVGASASRGGCWSGPKVAAWITKHPGRKTYAQRGGVYLRRLGWALQVPRRRHAQAATPARPHAFKKSSGARYPLCVRRLPGHGERGGRLSRPGAGSSPSSGACGHAGASAQGRAARTAMSGARSTGSPTRAMAEPRGPLTGRQYGGYATGPQRSRACRTERPPQARGAWCGRRLLASLAQAAAARWLALRPLTALYPRSAACRAALAPAQRRGGYSLLCPAPGVGSGFGLPLPLPLPASRAPSGADPVSLGARWITLPSFRKWYYIAVCDCMYGFRRVTSSHESLFSGSTGENSSSGR